jgi:hypothetical protein
VPALQVSPIVAALDHPEVTLDRETVPAVALSLVDAFAQVPDPRKARGIRHGVAAILLLGACAVLTGARSFAAIAEYAHDTGRTPRHAVPDDSDVRSESELFRLSHPGCVWVVLSLCGSGWWGRAGSRGRAGAW